MAVRRLPSAIHAAPVYADGTLLIAAEKRLYAIRETAPEEPPLPVESVIRGRAPDALFVPTPRDVVGRMMELAQVVKTDVVVDLGSGDGRVVVAAAQQGSSAVGYEIDRDLVERSRASIQTAKVGGLARIEHGDLLKADLADASVVYLYVGERLNRILIPKLQALKAGARIVSHEFEIPGLKPDHVLRVGSKEDGRDHALYLYSTPLKIRGNK